MFDVIVQYIHFITPDRSETEAVSVCFEGAFGEKMKKEILVISVPLEYIENKDQHALRW